MAERWSHVYRLFSANCNRKSSTQGISSKSFTQEIWSIIKDISAVSREKCKKIFVIAIPKEGFVGGSKMQNMAFSPIGVLNRILWHHNPWFVGWDMKNYIFGPQSGKKPYLAFSLWVPANPYLLVWHQLHCKKSSKTHCSVSDAHDAHLKTDFSV